MSADNHRSPGFDRFYGFLRYIVLLQQSTVETVKVIIDDTRILYERKTWESQEVYDVT